MLYLLTWSALNQITLGDNSNLAMKESSLSKSLTEAETYSLCMFIRGENSSDVALGWLRSCGFAQVRSWRLKKHKDLKPSSPSPWAVAAWLGWTQNPPRGQLGSLTARPHSQCLTCTQQTSSSRPEEMDFPKTELSLWTIQQKFSFQLWLGIHVANAGVN